MEASILGIDRRFTQLCIFEMLASDNRTVEEALAAYNQSLFSETDDDGPSSVTEMLYSSVISEILKATMSQVCPGQPACSGRGTCSNSTCTCNTGKPAFIGLLRGKKRLFYIYLSTCLSAYLAPIVSTDFDVTLMTRL